MANIIRCWGSRLLIINGETTLYMHALIITHILRGHQINHDCDPWAVSHKYQRKVLPSGSYHIPPPPFSNQNRLSAHYVIMQISRRRHKWYFAEICRMINQAVHLMAAMRCHYLLYTSYLWIRFLQIYRYTVYYDIGSPSFCTLHTCNSGMNQ